MSVLKQRFYMRPSKSGPAEHVQHGHVQQSQGVASHIQNIVIITALLLACLLIIPFISTTARAQDAQLNSISPLSSDPAELVSALKNGGTYKLEEDITLTAALVSQQQSIKVEQTTSIDTNGKTIYFDIPAGSINYPVFTILDGATLTIDRHTQAADAIRAKENTQLGEGALFYVKGTGSLVLRQNICDFKANNRETGAVIYADGGGSVTIDGASIKNCSNAHKRGIVWIKNGTLNFQSGSLTNCKITCDYGEANAPIVIGDYEKPNATTAQATFGTGVEISYCENNNESFYSASAITCLSSGIVEASGTITDCKNKGKGGAVFVQTGGKYTMKAGTIANSPANGGAVTLGNDLDRYSTGNEALFTMDGGTIASSNNTAASMVNLIVGGHFVLNANGVVQAAENCTQGGCFTVGDYSCLTINGATLKGNEMGTVTKGGLIYSTSKVEIKDAVLDGNGCETTLGGLIYVGLTDGYDNEVSLTITDSTLTGGQAFNDELGNKGMGGAIYMEMGSLKTTGEINKTSSSTTISDCHADTAGGGIYQKSGTIDLSGTLIKDCSAYVFSSMAANANETPVSYGGGIYTQGGWVKLRCETRIESCTTIDPDDDTKLGHGGGMFVEGFGKFETYQGPIITKCSTQGNGGGICFGGTKEFDRRDLAEMESFDIIENSAGQNGGGIWMGQGGNYWMRSVYVMGNTAGNAGGGVYLRGAKFDYTGTISGNTSKSGGGGICAQPALAGSSTGTTEIAFGQTASVKNNTSTDTEYENLYLDYRNTTEGLMAFNQSIILNLDSINDYSEIHLAVDNESLFKGGSNVKTIASSGWNRRSRIFMDVSTQLLVSDSAQKIIRVTSTLYSIHNRQELENALAAGGEYYLSEDIDLTQSKPLSIESVLQALFPSAGSQLDEVAESTILVSKDIVLHLQDHWITIDTEKAPGFTVAEGATLTLSSYLEGEQKGGLRGTITSANAATAAAQPALKVLAGGMLVLNVNLQNFGYSLNEYGGAVVDLRSDSSPTSQKQNAGVARLVALNGMISQCYAGSYGSAIYGNARSQIEIRSMTINGTTGSTYGSCVNMQGEGSQLTLNGATLAASGNQRLGGCVYLDKGATATISNSRLTGTKVYELGGVLYARDSTVSIDSSVLEKGQAHISGGGIYAQGVNLTLADTTTIENCTADDKGGGLWWSNMSIYRGKTLDTQATITKCKAADGGGVAVSVGESDLVVNIGGKITENEAIERGGGVYLKSNYQFESPITVSAEISNNKARFGAGLYVTSGVSLVTGSLTNNIASVYGGGIFADTIDSPTRLRLGNTGTVYNNHAAAFGGGICMINNSTKVTLKLSGTAMVHGNFVGDQRSNLFLTTQEELDKIVSVNSISDFIDELLKNGFLWPSNSSAEDIKSALQKSNLWSPDDGATPVIESGENYKWTPSAGGLETNTLIFTRASYRTMNNATIDVTVDATVEQNTLQSNESNASFSVETERYRGVCGVLISPTVGNVWPYVFAHISSDEVRHFDSDYTGGVFTYYEKDGALAIEYLSSKIYNEAVDFEEIDGDIDGDLSDETDNERDNEADENGTLSKTGDRDYVTVLYLMVIVVAASAAFLMSYGFIRTGRNEKS